MSRQLFRFLLDPSVSLLLVGVPALARAQAAFWASIRQLHEQALAGSDDDLLTKTTAGLLHPATFGALKAAGMSVDEAAAVVADLLVHRVRGVHP